MDEHDAGVFAEVPPYEVGVHLAAFFSFMRDTSPVVIADSVVDIGRFCRALSTGMDGGWESVGYPLIRFEVHDVAAYPTTLPGAVQHNAWWDAMALREKFATPLSTAPGGGGGLDEVFVQTNVEPQCGVASQAKLTGQGGES